ncbi:D-alanyl-D-alanine carboxypeptidase [Paenibacillus sp. DS2015]|uniref:M15 family metallopeptidase n=1 Tax=Paenibacillus sp. DS2015 TaxID=3373917 RepID=UPI003D22227A
MNSDIRKSKNWRWGVFAALILPAMLLAGCESDTEGSAQQEGQALQSPAESQGNESVEAQGEGQALQSPGNSQGNESVEGQLEGQATTVMAKRSESSLQATIEQGSGGRTIVTNPEAVTVIVNKQRSLPDGYEPNDLVEPNVPFSFDEPHEKRQLRKEAAEALEELFAEAKSDGIELRAVSGYRSYARQKSIYENNVRTKGEEYASRVSAVPGMSEHQTGLTMDVSSPSVNNAIEEVFGESVEGKWLAEHAAEFGFIIRYLEGKEEITGYVYEPWHIRYIGRDLATDLAASALTAEEYFDDANIKL